METAPSANSARILLEVAIASPEDMVVAQIAGADRVELNSALTLGGLTPSLGCLLEAVRLGTIPIMMMIRPRPGGFAYGRGEFEVMLRDIDLALEHGAKGIVFGLLTDDGNIDVVRTQMLIERISPVPTVFHRAFDVTPDPFLALRQLIDLGCTRVMTSGQEESAYNGADLIRRLIESADGAIEILPAGGVNPFTIHDIVTRTKCNQVHASLQGRLRDSSVTGKPHVHFGGSFRPPEDRYAVTDPNLVENLLMQLNPRSPRGTTLEKQ